MANSSARRVIVLVSGITAGSLILAGCATDTQQAADPVTSAGVSSPAARSATPSAGSSLAPSQSASPSASGRPTARPASHNACALLVGAEVDTTIFSGTFGAPVTHTSTVDGGERTTYACGNSDSSLSIEVVRLPSEDAARRDADYAVQEQYEDMLVGTNGVKKRYSDGGGYLINPDTGVARQTFTVGSWSILVEANFDDRVVARVEGKSDPIPTVVRTLDRIKTTVPQSVQNGRW